jgi:lipopolysaccharide export system permease protein
VIWALLLYGVYTYLLIYGRTLLEREQTPAWLGLWWVHVVALAVGFAFIRLPAFKDWLARRRAATA